MEMIPVTRGVSLVRIPEARLSILCGCPENAIKHLFKRGLIEKAGGDGRSYETGPNAILLSEVAVQNGRFANLAEFPVLHMLYRQGMIIPGHPGNTGLRPMLIGMPEQLEAVSKYIYAGNYGITDPGELSPEDPALAESLMKVKRWFAFGQFRQSDELLELKRIDGTILELRDGAFLRRLGVNRYEIIHGSQSVLVDLGLKTGQDYECPYSLPSLPASREGFAVIHLGEGDGWDPERPCMSSIVMNRGEAYLIDAGPNIEQSLEAVGLAVGCLKGIFQTDRKSVV